ncbi:MAG TPA: Lsr2 family protein [Acidimicrobiales bacterium]
MAKEVITRLLDDIDGTEAAETVRFGLDGRQYEIDLSAKNSEKLRKALAPFIEHARTARSSGSRRSPGGRRSAERDFEPAAVRQWAAKRGIKVSSRGRIPAEILERYKASRR